MIKQLRKKLADGRPLTQGDAYKLIKALDALDDVGKCFRDFGGRVGFAPPPRAEYTDITDIAPKFAEVFWQEHRT